VRPPPDRRGREAIIWDAATDTERRILLDELVPRVEVHADHLEVEIRGAQN
jgi:hypothetical protein